MLWLYRSALAIRRAQDGLRGSEFRWLSGPDGTLHFGRGAGFECVVNLSNRAVVLPPDRRPLLSSLTPSGGVLEPDAAAWYQAGASLP